MSENFLKVRPAVIFLPVVGDIVQFAAFFLLLGVCLPEILPITPLPLSRVLAFGLTFGVMKSVARIFSGEWTTKIPFWQRVNGEHLLLPCFVLGLFIAGEITPATVDLGDIKFKPADDVSPLSQTPTPGVMIARFAASLSYALSEAKAILILVASVACEAAVLTVRKFIFARRKAS